MGQGWNEEQDNVLREMWLTHSASEIACHFGDGKTRNAIMGRVNRLGLPRKGQGKSPAGRTCTITQSRPGRPRRPKMMRQSPNRFASVVVQQTEMFEPRLANIEPIMLTFSELGKFSCRYAYGDETPYLFCGHPQQAGSSYCEEHSALCHTPPRELMPYIGRAAA